MGTKRSGAKLNHRIVLNKKTRRTERYMALEHVKVLLAVDGRERRFPIKTILENNGFRLIETVYKFDDAAKELARGRTDMLVIDASFGDDRVPELVRQLRSNELECNPFISVLAVVHEPKMTLVHDLVNAGVDEIALAPLSASGVGERIEEMVERRKPFVVTSDYIGPDRRKSARKGQGVEVPLLEVPNIPKARKSGKVNTLQLEVTTRELLEDMNVQRVERLIDQLGWRLDRLEEETPWREAQSLNIDCLTHVGRIIEVANEIIWRSRRTEYSNFLDACEKLKFLCKSTRKAEDELCPQTRDLIAQVIRALVGRTEGEIGAVKSDAA